MKLPVRSRLFGAALAMLLATHAWAETSPSVTDLSSALLKAQDSGKPVFVYVFDSV